MNTPTDTAPEVLSLWKIVDPSLISWGDETGTPYLLDRESLCAGYTIKFMKPEGIVIYDPQDRRFATAPDLKIAIHLIEQDVALNATPSELSDEPTELDALRAEVKRLRFDEARINWMQENYTDTEFISSGEFREGCLREEIDFIMGGGSPE